MPCQGGTEYPLNRSNHICLIALVSVKVGEVLDPDVNPFYQIIGRKGETNKIRLREGYSRSHVFTKGNTYKVSVKSPDMGEVRRV